MSTANIISPNRLAGYQLLDFGDGRKLERFGEQDIARYCPAACDVRRGNDDLWQNIDAEFWGESVAGADQKKSQMKWRSTKELAPFEIELDGLSLELRYSPAGQMGFFPEHAAHWPWLADCDLIGKRVLNLFAYTGAMSLRLARHGAHVTHVDASKSVVRWARDNAKISELAEAPIRWIVEDVSRFVEREIKRGSRYDGFVCDPPTYGQGPKGQVWKIEQDFEPLVQALGELMEAPIAIGILSCHSSPFNGKRLGQLLANSLSISEARIEQGQVALETKSGRQLSSGCFARFHS